MKIIRLKLPNQYDDCTKKQLLGIIRTFRTKMTFNARLVKLFLILVQNQGDFFDKVSWLWQLKIKPWWAKSKLGKWIYSENGLNIDVNIIEIDFEDLSLDIIDATAFIFTDYLLKQKVKNIGFYFGPGNYFGDMTFQQFRDTDLEFLEMLDNQEQTDELVVTDEFIFKLYKPLFGVKWPKPHLSNELKELIYMYYVGNRKLLAEEFDSVFNSGGKNKSFDKNAHEKDWETILNEIAEKPQYYGVVDSLNVRSVLKNLDEKIKKQQALKDFYDNL